MGGQAQCRAFEPKSQVSSSRKCYRRPSRWFRNFVAAPSCKNLAPGRPAEAPFFGRLMRALWADRRCRVLPLGRGAAGCGQRAQLQPAGRLFCGRSMPRGNALRGQEVLQVPKPPRASAEIRKLHVRKSMLHGRKAKRLNQPVGTGEVRARRRLRGWGPPSSVSKFFCGRWRPNRSGAGSCRDNTRLECAL